MGIAPYKTFTFDGVSSDTYGVYITGEGVFNAPERDVEMIDIHGRNGAYAFDNGRFNNISVKYKIGMYDVNESNFATKMSNFRNWLCSKVGYVRLSDEYNPNEYRMAVYSGGLEVSHEFLIAGEAEITFECKPQRWLTSGETATAVANNGTLSNPTLFDASPLLEVKGYGSIDMGGQEIEIENVPLGNVVLCSAVSDGALPYTATFNGDLVNTNDMIPVSCIFSFRYWGRNTNYVSDTVVSSTTGCTVEYSRDRMSYIFSSITFTKGTASTTTGSATYTITVNGVSTTTRSPSFSIAYDGDDTITFSISGTTSVTNVIMNIGIGFDEIDCDSTVSALGNPLYIDLDIGEAWNEDGAEPVSCNSAVTLGSNLPTLPPGSTTFTYDNTITSFKVKPRWWKV